MTENGSWQLGGQKETEENVAKRRQERIFRKIQRRESMCMRESGRRSLLVANKRRERMRIEIC